MAPEITQGLTRVFEALVSGAVMLISAAAAYGVWKLRQIQQEKKLANEDQRDKSAILYLNDVINSAVAYTTQTMGLDKQHPLSEGVKMDAKRATINKTYEQLPEGIKMRLIEIYGSLSALNTYIEFRAEGEVGKQQVCNVAMPTAAGR
jgi:hypothetical protein